MSSEQGEARMIPAGNVPQSGTGEETGAQVMPEDFNYNTHCERCFGDFTEGAFDGVAGGYLCRSCMEPSPAPDAEKEDGLPDWITKHRYDFATDAEGFSTGNLEQRDYGQWVSAIAVHKLYRELLSLRKAAAPDAGGWHVLALRQAEELAAKDERFKEMEAAHTKAYRELKDSVLPPSVYREQLARDSGYDCNCPHGCEIHGPALPPSPVSMLTAQDAENVEIGRLTVLAHRLAGYCSYEFTDESLIAEYKAFCEKYGRTERTGVGRKKADKQVWDQVRILSSATIAKGERGE